MLELSSSPYGPGNTPRPGHVIWASRDGESRDPSSQDSAAVDGFCLCFPGLTLVSDCRPVMCRLT